MKAIHCNVSGTPTDTPRVLDDTGRSWDGLFEGTGRVSFNLPDDATGGGHLRWLDQQVNFLLPAAPGAYEGALIGLPTIAYAPARPLLWPICGATEFNLPAKMRSGEIDIRSILRQRKAAGATLVRSLAMGYPFRPDPQPLTLALAAQYWRICQEEGLYVLWCVFAGTRTVMPAPADQQQYWAATKEWAAGQTHVLLQLCNEWNHPTQSIDPSQFTRPASANLADHGPGMTDAPPVRPFWDVVTYHARRDGPPDGRAFTNYDCYGFESDWPKPCPMLPGEGAKPEDYGRNPAFAREMGKRCGINWGGVFHSDQGVRSDPWPPEVEACARAFYEAVDR